MPRHVKKKKRRPQKDLKYSLLLPLGRGLKGIMRSTHEDEEEEGKHPLLLEFLGHTHIFSSRLLSLFIFFFGPAPFKTLLK